LNKINDIRVKLKMSPVQTIAYIYKNTPAGSPLRKYMAAACAGCLKPTSYTSHPMLFPQEMLLDVARFLTEKIDDQAMKIVRPMEPFASDFQVPVEED
jgi:hypothetical protein